MLNINAQQTQVNREWTGTSGNPVFNPILSPFGFEWSKSITTATNDIITVSHTNVSGQGENILLTRYNRLGTLLWQVQYTTSGNKNEYGTDVIEDASGNIYVCGTTDNATTTNYDVVFLKYNSAGTLQWSVIYNGPNSLNDIGTSLQIEASTGNIFLATSREGTSSSYDFFILKYKPTGVVLWSNSYNYANLIDVPTGIQLIPGKAVVVGASASAANKWDYASVVFDPSTGSILSSTRDNLVGFGYDQPLAFKKDVAGNTYVTGRASSNGVNYDIRTIKISPTNTIVWTQTYDAFGLEDVGNTIAVDASGNILVGGFITKSNNIKDFILLKYSATGTLLWKQTQTSKDATADAYIKGIALNSIGDIYYIGGEKGIGANKQAIVGKIKSSGVKSWERSIKGNYNYLPSDIQYLTSGIQGLYTIAIKDSTTKVYETAYYTDFDRDTARAFVGNGKPYYKKHEFIVRFNPTYINPTKVNNRDITYGILSDFLTPAGITAFNSYTKLRTNDFKVFKVFPNLTKNDTLSVSRTGLTVKLLPLYATFGVIFPSTINDTLVERQLRNGAPITQAADLNYYVQLHNANDADYINGNSAGLDATSTYTGGSINISPAWAIETGNPNIIVGIFDSGINNTHSDFNTTSSKITTGYDYFNNLPYLSSLPVDKYGHGTGTAGLIGALRNNTIGISGVAGGDATQSNTGVTLNDMKCFEGNDQGGPAPYFASTLDVIERAMIDGALSSPTANIGQGQHVQNHSWGTASNFGPNDSILNTVKDAIRTVFENECLISFSSGNGQNASFTNYVYSTVANFKDEFNLCVGGNDATGGRWSTSTNGSNGGKYLDFIAPASSDLFNLLSKSSNATTDTLKWGTPTTTYTSLVGGTSFAAPHAAGVAALMISYVNNNPLKPNNISPEDIEKIMEKNTTDLSAPPYSAGYDAQTGYGRVNAGAAMQQVKLPNYQVKHYNVNTTVANTSTALVGSQQSIWFPHNYLSFSWGYGVVNKYSVTYTNNHSLSGNYTIIDAWKRDATSNLTGDISVPIPPGASTIPENSIPNETNVLLQSYNNSSATLKGYVYEFLVYSPSTSSYTSTGIWYPFSLAPTNQIKFGYTLHLKDPTVGVKELTMEKNAINVFPNPANDKIIISFDTEKTEKTEVIVIDVMGKLLIQEEVGYSHLI